MSLLLSMECSGSTALCNLLFVVRFPLIALSWVHLSPNSKALWLGPPDGPGLSPAAGPCEHPSHARSSVSHFPPRFRTDNALSFIHRQASCYPISQPGALGTSWLQDSFSQSSCLVLSGDSFVWGFFLGFHPLCRDFPQATLRDPGVVLLSEIFPPSSLVLGLGPAAPMLHSTIEFA